MNEVLRALKLHFKQFCTRNGISEEEGKRRLKDGVRTKVNIAVTPIIAIEWLATH
jgi:hypothetical protein